MIIPFFCPHCGADLSTLEPIVRDHLPGWHCPICESSFDVRHPDCWHLYRACRAIEEAEQ